MRCCTIVGYETEGKGLENRPDLVWSVTMKLINIQAAKTHLSRIVEDVVEGEDVVLAKSGKPMVRLVRYAQTRKPRQPGRLAGKGWEAPDCWEPGESELESSIEEPILREEPALAPVLPRRPRILRLLLDSHVVVWWLTSPERLSAETRALIAAPGNDIILSAASVWELGLKIARRKLTLPEDYVDCLLDDGFEELPVTLEHAQRAMRLPPLHGDPFDRLLIAQALEEDLVLVTSDHVISSYNVPTREA